MVGSSDGILAVVVVGGLVRGESGGETAYLLIMLNALLIFVLSLAQLGDILLQLGGRSELAHVAIDANGLLEVLESLLEIGLEKRKEIRKQREKRYTFL